MAALHKFSTTITCPFHLKDDINITIHPLDHDVNALQEKAQSNGVNGVNGDIVNTKSITTAPTSAVLLATKSVNDETDAPAGITIPASFNIHSVDAKLDPRTATKSIHTFGSAVKAADPPLGVLESFTGHFAGTGFNTIFRPNSGAAQGGTTFPNPVSGNPIPQVPNESVLELNLTTETLTFSKPLGDVPNRGLQAQKDIHLNGVPYLQSISDVTNIKTGKADGVAQGIHFEPGLWMHVPATTEDPIAGESLVRMASIPHGTTINAQCLVPAFTVAGPPIFTPQSITPFPIGLPAGAHNPVPPFAAQTATRTDTPRIPQDLTNFIAAGTITQAMLDDPNTKLRNDIVGQNITKTIVFTVSTSSGTAGGGVANIDFLQGAPADPTGVTTTQTGPNATAALMTATFWIETVQYTLTVPPFKPGQSHAPLRLEPAKPHPGAIVPYWEVTPPHEIMTPKTITVTATQIQYSQNVSLNFAGLTWPHVSVATLVPSKGQRVPDDVWK